MRLLSTFGLLGLVWAGPTLAQTTGGPPNQIICNKVASFSGVAVSTQLVAAITGQSIFVCGWHVTNTAGSGTFQFTTGTGTACATGSANVTPALNVTSSAPSADHVDYATISSSMGNAFCVIPSVTTLSGLIFYSQF